MPILTRSLGHVICIAALGAVSLAATANAGIEPALEFDFSASTGYADVFNPSVISDDGTTFNFVGSVVTADFSISWNLNARPDMAPFGSLASNFTVESFSDEAIEFTLRLTLPMNEGASPGTLFGGSAAFGLTGIDGNLSPVGDVPMWAALIDGTEVGSLYDSNDTSGIQFAGNGSGNLGGSTIGGVTGPMSDTIGITLNFSLSGGDTVITTGILGVMPVPAPGALALFGAAGLISRRRRRRD